MTSSTRLVILIKNTILFKVGSASIDLNQESNIF